MKIAIRLFLVLLVTSILALVTSYIWWSYDQAQTHDPYKVIQKVSKLVDLPAGETPVVALVADERKLKNQQFFLKAKEGDIVLIYKASKRAILYRPELNKVVEIGPYVSE